MSTLCEEIGIENTEDIQNEEITASHIDIAESIKDLHQLPLEVNAFELPFNFSQTKRLKLAVDLRPK